MLDSQASLDKQTILPHIPRAYLLEARWAQRKTRPEARLYLRLLPSNAGWCDDVALSLRQLRV